MEPRAPLRRVLRRRHRGSLQGIAAHAVEEVVLDVRRHGPWRLLVREVLFREFRKRRFKVEVAGGHSHASGEQTVAALGGGGAPATRSRRGHAPAARGADTATARARHRRASAPTRGLRDARGLPLGRRAAAAAAHRGEKARWFGFGRSRRGRGRRGLRFGRRGLARLGLALRYRYRRSGRRRGGRAVPGIHGLRLLRRLLRRRLLVLRWLLVLLLLVLGGGGLLLLGGGLPLLGRRRGLDCEEKEKVGWGGKVRLTSERAGSRISQTTSLGLSGPPRSTFSLGQPTRCGSRKRADRGSADRLRGVVTVTVRCGSVPVTREEIAYESTSTRSYLLRGCLLRRRLGRARFRDHFHGFDVLPAEDDRGVGFVAGGDLGADFSAALRAERSHCGWRGWRWEVGVRGQ